jgi:hypothetical protein
MHGLLKKKGEEKCLTYLNLLPKVVGNQVKAQQKERVASVMCQQ